MPGHLEGHAAPVGSALGGEAQPGRAGRRAGVCCCQGLGGAGAAAELSRRPSDRGGPRRPAGGQSSVLVPDPPTEGAPTMPAAGAKPQTFNWPGCSIAIVTTDSAESPHAILMFGTHAGVVLARQHQTWSGWCWATWTGSRATRWPLSTPPCRRAPPDGSLSGVVQVVVIAVRAAPCNSSHLAGVGRPRRSQGDRYAAKARHRQLPLSRRPARHDLLPQ